MRAAAHAFKDLPSDPLIPSSSKSAACAGDPIDPVILSIVVQSARPHPRQPLNLYEVAFFT
jgi:hypothetical protein